MMNPLVAPTIAEIAYCIQILTTSSDPSKLGLVADSLERASASIRRILNGSITNPKEQTE